ncbi:unnamed protein product [Somion occarium]|uniref:Non-specific serine/threonine protein kinase n=1 Tax=Somion occarium TaxID=3059160 RepID=A0ABP1CR94_9APHY
MEKLRVPDNEEAYCRYPEQSIYEFTPLPYNLIPSASQEDVRDPPDFIASAVRKAKDTKVNPLCTWLGEPPIYVNTGLMLPGQAYKDIELKGYVAPPPLGELLGCDLTILEQINPNGNHAMFRVRVGSEERLLKTFLDDSDYDDDDDETESTMDQFLAERDAYAHLIHYGACDAGVVPRCYGWLRLSKEVTDFVAGHSSYRCWGPFIRRQPLGILLEYFPDTSCVSFNNITFALAQTAMKAMCRIHQAYVLHGDLASRNCLLLPSGRIVWVDFDHSSNPSSKKPVKRLELWLEIAQAWGLFYGCLLPDMRIGYQSRSY